MANITGDGALVADTAVLSASGSLGHAGTANLIASTATVVAAGQHGSNGVANLAADTATIQTIGASRGVTGTAVLVADPASAAGVGFLGNFGNFVMGEATLAATGTVQTTIIANVQADTATLQAFGVIYVPNTGILVAETATMQAFGVIGHVGTADLVASQAEVLATTLKVTSITGVILAPFTPTGALGAAIAGDIPATFALTGILNKRNYITGTIEVTFQVQGALKYQASEASGLEGDYELTGKRSSTPTLVYLLDATLLLHVSVGVPDNRSFLVPAHFVAQLGDLFSEAGAGPDYIGTKKKDSLGGDYVVFRKPVLNEVVWYVPDNVLYRFEFNRDTKMLGWKKYLSLPQRALGGQFVFSMFDPEKVYDYYALIWGGLMWRWSYDTAVIAQQLDPDRCASFYLGALASQWGYALPSDETLSARRALTRNAVPSFKFKGLMEAIRLRLQSLGFRGYANEIWVNPDNIANGSYESLVPINTAGEPSVATNGAGLDYIERPHGYDNTDPVLHWPSSRLALHVNEIDGTPIDFAADPVKLGRIIRALSRDVVPAHVDLRYLSTDHNVLGNNEAELIAVGDDLDIYDVQVLGEAKLAASPALMLAFGSVT